MPERRKAESQSKSMTGVDGTWLLRWRVLLPFLRRASVGVNPDVLDEHLRGERRVGVWRAGAGGTYSEIEQDEVALPPVERPDGALEFRHVCGGVGDVGMRGVIDVIGDGAFGPDHAVVMPLRGGLVGGETEDGAESGVAGEAHAVNRALVPVGVFGRVHAFQHVLFAAGGPVNRGDVVAHEPGRGPEALRLGHYGADFETAILKAEEALGFEARRCADAGRGLLRSDVQIAVLADVGARVGGGTRHGV